MANPLKQLAGETAIYGLSTILARIINFAFVPFYTRLLTQANYGVVSEFMAYIAVLQVILVLGLETGCFRFANKDNVSPVAVYSNALATTFGIGSAFFALLVVFAKPLSASMGYSSFHNIIIYVGGILALDSVTAILFAKLRQEHKALKFAIFKTVKILTETAGNIILFFPFAKYCLSVASISEKTIDILTSSDVWLLHFVSATPDFTYPIFAILLSCIMCAILFLPDMLKFSFEFDGELLKKMLAYSIPLMVASLPGVVNDFLDRILFRYFDKSSEVWQASLGVYQASVKLAVIMNLFIQMFRFAAEPFFFQRAKEKGSKELYAIVMEFFVAFCGLIFLGVLLYIDVFSLILGKDFRGGIGIVPVMMLSYMLLGMLFNVSMWYKLSEKTNMAIWITLSGLMVTAAINIVFMPRYSYWAAAFGHLASYLVMFVISVALGTKYYPIPYNWKRIFSIGAIMALIFVVSLSIDRTIFPDIAIGASSSMKIVFMLIVHSVLLFMYAAICFLLLKKQYIKIRNL